MGTDIHAYAEVRHNGVWHINTRPVFRRDTTYQPGPDLDLHPFDWRSYRLFGLLAAVRHHTITPIAEPRGLPADVSPEVAEDLDGDLDQSWLTLAELQQVDPAATYDGTPDGEPLSEFLGGFFAHVEDMTKLGAPDDVRVVFAFSY